MKKRLAALFLVGLLAVVSFLVLFPTTQKAAFRVFSDEPFINGHSLSGWMELLRDPDPEVRKEAITNLGDLHALAAPAVPALTEIAWHDHISVRAWAISSGLGQIGPAAVPSLVALLKDRSVRSVTVATLGNIGPAAKDAVPGLIDALKDKLAWTRWQACGALGKIGPDAKSAVPALIQALHDPAEAVRSGARAALQRIDPQAAARADVH